MAVKFERWQAPWYAAGVKGSVRYMSTIDDLSRRLYQSFQEWRIRVLGVITELDRIHLEPLAGDLRATLTRIEQELETRRTRRDREQ